MAARSKDLPPMLATRRYAQWQSHFLRYIGTRTNGDALRKRILQGPYTPTTVIIPTVLATYDTPAVPKRTVVEIILTMSPENKAHYESEKKSIHLLLTEIGDEIYSTVDACKTAHDMWIAIERLQQGEYLNSQDVKTNLFLGVRKFTSHNGESMEFVTIVKQQHELDTVSYHALFDKLKQYQKEVNDIRAERIAKYSNPLILIAAASPHPDPYYQALKSHKPYPPASKQSSSTRSNTSTKFKGKEIAKPITPLSKKLCSATDWDTMFQLQGIGHFAKECKKSKRVKDSRYHKEKMLLCKQAEKGVPLQVEQSDWLADTDEEIDEQELEAYYSFMEKIQEVPTADLGNDTEPLEQDDSNVTPDSPDMCENDIQTDQNAKDKRAVLANLITNLKLDVDENKKIQKQLKKASTSLAHELKECKSILAETSRTLGESNSIRDSCLIALQNK
nr:hypothetical protein [Tanacetum cinerariifolium]